MIKKLKEAFDSNDKLAKLLINYPKTFESTDHSLLRAKLLWNGI